MNCIECRDNLVARVEGLLNGEEARECAVHLESCENCRDEYNAITILQQRLVARGQVVADFSVIAPVMQRVRAVQPAHEKETIMSVLLRRWRFGLGAVAVSAAIVAGTLMISSP